MVDAVLYLLARNLDNAQLAWSRDHGVTWTWARWKFTTGFGCPAFINFGPDYAGARNHYVYIHSFDSDTAYEAADRMVLARVPKESTTRPEAYDYFVRLDSAGRPSGQRTSRNAARS